MQHLAPRPGGAIQKTGHPFEPARKERPGQGWLEDPCQQPGGPEDLNEYKIDRGHAAWKCVVMCR